MRSKLTNQEFYQIVGALRRCFGRSQLRRDVVRAVRVEEPKILKDGTLSDKPRISYICQLCGISAGGAKNKSRSHIVVDHIEPVVPVGKTYADMSFDELIERMYCDPSGLQVICNNCHFDKTAKERDERVRLRRERKAANEQV